MGHRGCRTSPVFLPMNFRAVLAGVGLVSKNMASIRGHILKCSSRARSRFPAKKALHRPAMSPGATLETTEITPWPPTANSGSTVKSSPDSTVILSPHSSRTLEHCFRSPVASLIPWMVGSSASRATVSGSRLTLVRDGTL